MKLSSKHRKTLQAIFDNPVRSDVEWKKIESLFSALRSELTLPYSLKNFASRAKNELGEYSG